MLPPPPPPPPHSQPPALPLPPGARPTPAYRPLAHSGFAAQSLTFRTGVRSHVLADSPHFPSTASSASSWSSSLPTSTRRLELQPGEDTHNQVGLRTGALGGSRWALAAREGKGHCASSSSVTRRARPPTAGVRRPGRGRSACASPRTAGSAYLPAPSPPPRAASRRRRGVLEVRGDWSRRRAEAGTRQREGAGARAPGGSLGCLLGAGLAAACAARKGPKVVGWDAEAGRASCHHSRKGFPGHLRARESARRPFSPELALDGLGLGKSASFQEGYSEAWLPVVGCADFTVCRSLSTQ